MHMRGGAGGGGGGGGLIYSARISRSWNAVKALHFAAIFVKYVRVEYLMAVGNDTETCDIIFGQRRRNYQLRASKKSFKLS